MPRQYRPAEFERIDDRQHVVTESIGRVSRGGRAGKFWRELIKDVCRVPEACQQNHRPSGATQSSTSSLMSLSTVTSCTLCGDGSFQALSGVARWNSSGRGWPCVQVPLMEAPSALTLTS